MGTALGRGKMTSSSVKTSLVNYRPLPEVSNNQRGPASLQVHSRLRVGKGPGDTVQISGFTNRIMARKGGEISPQGHAEMSQISTQASSYPLGAVDATMASVYSITDVKWVMIKSRLLFRIRLTYKK